jgi:hypothetical protein
MQTPSPKNPFTKLRPPNLSPRLEAPIAILHLVIDVGMSCANNNRATPPLTCSVPCCKRGGVCGVKIRGGIDQSCYED